MLKAITEAGIPIDMVGGVSIGAFMGALYCLESELEDVRLKARSWAMKITSVWSQILDLTYPATAMFTGSSFNRTIYEVFGETTQIEDLWLPYFTVSLVFQSYNNVHRRLIIQLSELFKIGHNRYNRILPTNTPTWFIMEIR